MRLHQLRPFLPSLGFRSTESIAATKNMETPDGRIDSDTDEQVQNIKQDQVLFSMEGTVPRDSLILLSWKRQKKKRRKPGGYHGGIMQSNPGSHKNALANNDRTHRT